MRTEPVPQRKARGGSRVTVSGRSGMVTLHLNGEVFYIPLDDASKLAELCRACARSHQDDLARKLKLILDRVRSQPRYASFEESWSELRQQIRRDTLQAEDGTLSSRDASLLSAVNDYMVTQLARRRRRIRLSTSLTLSRNIGSASNG